MTPDQLIAAENETRGKEMRAILAALAPMIAEQPSMPFIVAGDFNSPSHLDWIPATTDRHRDLVVAWPVSKAMAEAGFADGYRVVHPDPATHPGRTWSPRFPDAWQDRIDYVYYRGRGLRATTAEMLDHHEPRWPSDHAAVLVTLELGAQRSR